MTGILASSLVERMAMTDPTAPLLAPVLITFGLASIATGIVPRSPAIAGIDGANVLSYVDVLRGAPVGRRVAVIGAGGIGFDVSEFLLHRSGDPLPMPRDAWLAEWGVDLTVRERGGLKPPAPVQPRCRRS